MSSKQKYITIHHGFTADSERDNQARYGTAYKVHSCKNSLAYNPGQVITRAQAEELCAAKDWTVTVEATK